jgi:hypothetical protein
MKIKLFFLALFSITLHGIIVAKPLTIINATTSPMTVKIFIQNYDQPIRVTIYPNNKQEYELGDEIFDRIVWSTYGKKDSPNAFLLKKYVVNVQEKWPTMIHGGAVVFSRGGEYVYDDKSGKKNAVKFGKGSIK